MEASEFLKACWLLSVRPAAGHGEWLVCAVWTIQRAISFENYLRGAYSGIGATRPQASYDLSGPPQVQGGSKNWADAVDKTQRR